MSVKIQAKDNANTLKTLRCNSDGFLITNSDTNVVDRGFTFTGVGQTHNTNEFVIGGRKLVNIVGVDSQGAGSTVVIKVEFKHAGTFFDTPITITNANGKIFGSFECAFETIRLNYSGNSHTSTVNLFIAAK